MEGLSSILAVKHSRSLVDLPREISPLAVSSFLQYAVKCAPVTLLHSFVIPSITEIVDERCILRDALLASIAPRARKWAKKRRVAAARVVKRDQRAAELKQYGAELAAAEERSRELQALVVLQFARSAVGAFLLEPVAHPAFAPPSVFDASPEEMKAPSGALVSALVAARVGLIYGVKSSPPTRSTKAKPRPLCQVFGRCGGRTRAFCYTDPSHVLVADMLCSVNGGASSDGYFLFGGKPLSGDVSLLDLNIQSGSTLDFCGRLRGGMDGAGGGAEDYADRGAEDGAGGGGEDDAGGEAEDDAGDEAEIAAKKRKKRLRQNEDDDEHLLLLQAGAAAAAAAALAAALVVTDAEVDGRSLPRPGGSNADRRPDYWGSPWGRMLTDQVTMLNDPTSPQAKIFRRRFRTPFPLYEMHVADCKEHLGSKTPIAGREAVPMELKVLGVLRILGRGCSTDDVKELSGISETAMSKFFHKFCKRGRDVLFPKFVSWPTTIDEISKAMGPYMAVGLDGAIGSTDAVHIAWGMCPRAIAVMHTGKEGYVKLALLFVHHSLLLTPPFFCASIDFFCPSSFPTIVYNVTGSHDQRILAVSIGTYGSCNDKTLIRFDDFIRELRENPLYTTDTTYALQVKHMPTCIKPS